MSNNDIIKRGELKKQILDYVRTHIVPTVTGVLALIDDAPAVPQEMSAREFVATISDMCINQFPKGCAPCPLWVAGHGCGEKILPPEDTVTIVEAWAKEGD